MIDIFTDSLFRLGIGYLVAEQAHQEQVEKYKAFQRTMTKLKEAEYMKEFRTTTGGWYIEKNTGLLIGAKLLPGHVLPKKEPSEVEKAEAKLKAVVQSLPDNVLNELLERSAEKIMLAIHGEQ